MAFFSNLSKSVNTHRSFSQEHSGAFTTKLIKRPWCIRRHLTATWIVQTRAFPSLCVAFPFSFLQHYFISTWVVVTFLSVLSQGFYFLIYLSTSYYLLFTMYKACLYWTSLAPINWFYILIVHLLLDWGSSGLGCKTPIM